jgi:sugar phosphate isomerase/epimerase
MSKKKVGLQLYTMRDFLKTPEDTAKTLKRVKEIGYDIVQMSGCGVKDAKLLRKIVDDAGLIANSAHENYDRLTKETDILIEESKIMGYTTLACPWLGEEWRSAEGYKRAAEALSAVGEKFYKNGIILTYHNHEFEFEKYGDKLGIEILYAAASPKYLQSEIDTYWAQFGGADPAEWLLRMKNRAPIVHLKDMAIKPAKKHIMVPIGEGNLNWKRILEVLKKLGTKFYYIEQDDCNGEDQFDCIRRSLFNLKKMGVE